MFGLRISADGRIVEIPNPPADLADQPRAIAGIVFGSIGADWDTDPFDVLSWGLLNDETGSAVFAVGNTDTDQPVNLPGLAVLDALGLPVTGEDWPENGTVRDAVWVFHTDRTDYGFTEVPADIVETVRRAAESAPVEGRAVASVPDEESAEDAALRALVASLGELDGVSVLTLDPSDPAGTLASLARELGEAPPVGQDYAHDARTVIDDDDHGTFVVDIPDVSHARS